MTTKRYAVIGSAVLALLLAAFLGGRYSRPAQVVTRDVLKTQTVEVEKVRTITVHDQVAVHDQAEKVRTVVVTKTRWLPGGAVEAETTTTRAKDVDTHQATQERSQATQDAARSTETHLEQTHIVEATERPRWSVALMPGAQFAGARAVTLYGPAVVGASVEHRFIGPIYLGAWASTSGAGGVSIRCDM